MGAILLEEYKVGGQGISRGHIKLSLIEIASLFHQNNTPLIKWLKRSWYNNFFANQKESWAISPALLLYKISGWTLSGQV